MPRTKRPRGICDECETNLTVGSNGFPAPHHERRVSTGSQGEPIVYKTHAECPGMYRAARPLSAERHELIVRAGIEGHRKVITYHCRARECGTSGRISAIPHGTADGVFALVEKFHADEIGGARP